MAASWDEGKSWSAADGMLEGVPPGLESSYSPPPESCPPPPYRLSLSLPALAPSPSRWEEVARKRRQRRARLELPERDLHLTWYKMIISAITAVQNDQNQSGNLGSSSKLPEPDTQNSLTHLTFIMIKIIIRIKMMINMTTIITRWTTWWLRGGSRSSDCFLDLYRIVKTKVLN